MATAECVKLANLDVEVVFMVLVPTVSTQFARRAPSRASPPST